MKSIYKNLILLPVLSFVLAGCSSDEPFSVATETDEPHILDPTFPSKVNGQLPVVANINRAENFKMTLTVTPSQSTEVEWFIDGEKIATGTTIDMPLLAGSYQMKVTATTTAGKSTYREGIVNVATLDGDPWANTVSFERIIAPGSNAMLYGDNLQKVKSLRLDDTDINSVTYNAEDGSLSYTVPASIANGTMRVVLIDAEGMEYGANTVTVSSSPLITSGADRMTAGAKCVLTGINLDQISKLSLGGHDLNIVKSSASEITVDCPALEDGEYKLTGVYAQGTVQFFIEGSVKEESTVIVSSEQTIWSGHHYVSWDLPDDSPNKTFNLISADVFSSMKPGSIMTIHYSVEPSAEYHQLRTVTGWWNDLPGTAVIEFMENGSKEVVMTAEVLAAIAEQSGFLCVGHGYYVDLVTLR